MKFGMDLKKAYYISTVLLVFIAIVVYFLFFMGVEGLIIGKYLPKSQADSILVSKSNVYQDLMRLTLILVFVSIGVFLLPFFYALCTYAAYIKKPLSVLRAGFKSVKDGDFDTRLEVKGLVEIAAVFDDFNAMVKACQKKISIKHYVSGSTEKMVDRLNAGEITTQPHRKLVTILFSDVREFTAFSEQNDPLMVIGTINEIFDIQVAAVRRNGGDIDKFIGDEIMVEFPSPAAAFKAADEIQSRMAAYNRKRRFPLAVGIGINYGEAVVGAVGSADQFNWTTIGHTVNVARRLCGIAEAGAIVISDSVFERLKIKRACDESDVKVKGISKPVHAHVIRSQE